jgi:hypothetical protein
LNSLRYEFVVVAIGQGGCGQVDWETKLVQPLCYAAVDISDFYRFAALVGSAPVIEGVSVQLAWAEDGFDL